VVTCTVSPPQNFPFLAATVFVISPELGGRGGEGRSAKSPLALSLSRSLMSLSLRDDSRCKRVAAIRWRAVFKRTTLGLTAREVT